MNGTVYILDAHAIIWYLANDARLSERAAMAIECPDALIVVPAMVLAEVASCHARGRTSVSLADALRFIDEVDNCVDCPTDRQVVELMPPARTSTTA